MSECNSDYFINGGYVAVNHWTNRQASDMVKEFHLAFGHPVANEPGLVDEKLAKLRRDLILEEALEACESSVEGDLVNFAKELADILYVVHGAAHVYGIDLDAVVAEVHRSNMSKLGADGKPILREDGKVLKGPNYSPPDIERILKNDSLER